MDGVTCGVIGHRSRRAFFFTQKAQHVETWQLAGELVRATAMVLGILSWGAVFLLLAG